MNGYLYETHCHTQETSECGHMPGKELAEWYAENGFAGIVVTDHLQPKYLQRVDVNHNWDEVIDHLLTGYWKAKHRGEELGLDVILGVELRFPENDNDYLVYGIDEAWLRENPYVCMMSAREFYQKFHDQLLIIHAHPYRDGNEEVFEDAVHGAELINAHPRHENRNELALELCRRHPEYLRLAGSDAHQMPDRGRAGVILPERVKDSRSYQRIIEERRFHLWSPLFQEYVDADERMRNET